MTIRIYLESKWTADSRLLGAAHTYLVMRDMPDGVDPSTFIGSEDDQLSRWIGGHPSKEDYLAGVRGAGGPIETAEKQFFRGENALNKDWYFKKGDSASGASGTPPAQRGKLDITAIVTAATGKSAEDSWNLLVTYANGLDGKYDYSIPLNSNTPSADCNATMPLTQELAVVRGVL
jgi:hypothetical protein